MGLLTTIVTEVCITLYKVYDGVVTCITFCGVPFLRDLNIRIGKTNINN